MSISRYLLILAAFILLSPTTTFSAEIRGAERELAAEVFEEAFSNSHSPVLIKYIASENNCRTAADENAKSVTIYDKNGALKTYNEVVFIEGSPVIDAGILERDLGWTVCKHIPETDMFSNETDAALAGGFTYFDPAGDTVYYVGNCYYGYYFAKNAGEHAASCVHSANAEMFYELEVKVVKQGLPSADAGVAEPAADTDGNGGQATAAEHEGGVKPARPGAFDWDVQPVLLKYIIRKNGYGLDYKAEDKALSILGADGAPLFSLKYVPSLYGLFAADAETLSRMPEFGNTAHEPDVDLFDKEIDAVIAGWLTYYRESENTPFTLYIGNCYDGYYFSTEAGRHAAGCDHSLNANMFYERTVTIENGAVLEDGSVIPDIAGIEFSDYARASMSVIESRPEQALTKMVTVSHSEYANEGGVQAAYFSYRDRVYRNFWEDLAGYDVADYIFIPPNMPVLDNYAGFNEQEALEASEAIKQLLAFKPGAKLWLGTTGITSLNYSHDKITAEVLTDYIERLKKRLGSDIWENNVEGLYINQESIYQEEGRRQVNIINRVVNQFKQGNPSKKALWIPYYDLAENSSAIAGKIAELSRVPGLFDYIIIQPGYFFFEQSDGALDPATTRHRKQNVDAVMRSAENSYVSNALGNPVDGEASSAKIGIEMEPQASYFSSSRDTRGESLDRYTSYLMAGAKVKDKSPVAFYTSGDPHCNKEVLVYKFYGADELNPAAVRKKLDASLDRFYGYVFETREKDKVFAEYAKAMYLRLLPEKTEGDFTSAYNAALVIPMFYKYEKTHNMSDLAAYITDGGEMPEYFDIALANALGFTYIMEEGVNVQ